MRVRSIKNTSPYSDPGWALLLVGVSSWLTLGFLAPLLTLIPPCVFRSLTGLPCPSCGSTRAALALASGELLDALCLQPLFVVVCSVGAMFVVHALLATVTGNKLKIELAAAEWLALRGAMVVLVALNWSYLVIAGR